MATCNHHIIIIINYISNWCLCIECLMVTLVTPYICFAFPIAVLLFKISILKIRDANLVLEVMHS